MRAERWPPARHAPDVSLKLPGQPALLEAPNIRGDRSHRALPAFSRRHPLRFAPYVQVPGADLAVEFFLRFGGSEVHFARARYHGGAATSMIGIEKIATLGARHCIVRKRIPLAIRWIAAVLT